MATEKHLKACAAGAVILLVSACGGGTAPTSQETVTVTNQAPGTVSVPATVPSVSRPTPSAPPPSDAPPSTAPTRAPSVEAGVVPNVVGVNHQLAQDTMQAAGYYRLAEEDATGQGRMLISDRNWVVVSQQPAGGTRAPADTTITLRSKKIGE